MSIHRFALALCLIFVASLAAPAVRSQTSQAAQTLAPALRMGRYDKSTEVTSSGTIASIQTQKSTTLPRGAYLVVHSGAVTLNVQMGLFPPGAIPFAAGDQVQVTGSLISTSGGQILLARQVQSASQTITVRTPNGFVLRPHPAGHVQSFSQAVVQ
jgi:hypothetical protein